MLGKAQEKCHDFSENYDGWVSGIDRLSSAFSIAYVLSYGLSSEELNLLADYCSLLSHCFRSISACEQWYRE